jgi:hypothetical protein
MLLWNAVLRQCLQSYLVTAINTMIATTKISIKKKVKLDNYFASYGVFVPVPIFYLQKFKALSKCSA